MDSNKNNIDSLLDSAIDSPGEEKDEVKTRSAKEVAENELFAIKPQIDMENINRAMGKGVEQDFQSNLSEKNTSSVSPKPVQESIDFSAPDVTYFNVAASENERNYRKRLSRLIKSNEVETKPFQVSTKDEGDITVEPFRQENDIPLPFRDFDETQPKEGETLVQSSISRRTYTPKTAIDDTANFIFINKCIFMTLAIICGVCLLETGIMYFIINTINPIHSVFYFVAMLLSFIPLGFGVFKYSLNPHRKIRKKFNYASMFLNSFIVVVILAVMLLIIVLLSSISLTDPTDYVPKLILPILFILNYPLGVLTFMLISKTKLFYVKK